ncbi:MAG: hypothetical protein IKS64_04595, partial [Muribaculaceae bacterium]|nr:hypothetical protein [Muribaculaceae bacterium]
QPTKAIAATAANINKNFFIIKQLLKKLIIKRLFNAANVAAIFELPNFFVLNFIFLALLSPFWALLRVKFPNFAVWNRTPSRCSTISVPKWAKTRN